MNNSEVSYNGHGTSNGNSMPTAHAFLSGALNATPSELVTQADRDEALRLVAQLRDLFPNLRDIPAEERKALFGMGDKNRIFAGKVLEVIQQNPEFLPRSFSADRLQQNLVAFDRLSTILMAINQLRDLLDATTVSIGSEAFEDALAAYRYAKASGQGASLEGMIDEMGQRFRKSKKKKADEKPEAGE